MDENLKLIGEYALRAYQIMSPEGWLITGFGTLIVCMVAYYNSQWHKDRAVSRRTIKTKHRAMLDQGQQVITQAFEDQVKAGKMAREDVDFIYKMIGSGCPKLKELGPEPTFGKPWYKGTTLPEGAAKVKASIFGRLRQAGMSTKQIWDAKRRIHLSHSKADKAKEELEALVASMKPKA